MHPITRRLGRFAALLVAVATLTGCVSSKYKMAEYEKRAQPLNLAATPPPTNAVLGAEPAATPVLDATVNTVIALQGPGSWKRNAYWDEYVVSLTNRSGAPIVIESATLTDFQGQTVQPGNNPWALEKQSRDYESRIVGTAGDVLKIGGGVILASGTGLAAGGVAAWATGASGWAAAGVMGTAFLAAIPVYAVGTVYRNVSNKHKIEEEFAHRSLALPLALPPGKPAQGSLFFRISPGPQRLALRARAGDGSSSDVVIDLAPLAGLHLKPGLAPKGGSVSP